MGPYKSGLVDVGKLKNGAPIKVYFEFWGNPKGVPVLYLHGGPGDHVSKEMPTWFNQTAYNILLFDQRGCGKSEPRNHTEQNTTAHLISDIELLRKMVPAEKMVVAGGSWGTALAILYAEKYPQRVLGLILRGVYDLDLSDPIIPLVYPKEDDQMNALVPSKTQTMFFKKITRLLKGKRTAKRRKVVDLLTTNAPLFVMSRNTHRDTYKDKETLAVVGNHYEAHHFFKSKKLLYKNLRKIKHIPTIMVEGRYDIVTPMYIAEKMCKLMPKCDLRIVKSGHAAMEPETKKALVKASADMLRLI